MQIPNRKSLYKISKTCTKSKLRLKPLKQSSTRPISWIAFQRGLNAFAEIRGNRGHPGGKILVDHDKTISVAFIPAHQTKLGQDIVVVLFFLKRLKTIRLSPPLKFKLLPTAVGAGR